MTDSTTPTPDQLEHVSIELPAGFTIVVPEGADALDNLTVAELDIASRQLHADVYAVALGHPQRDPQAGSKWKAYALLAWLWAKRTDPHAKLAGFLELSGPQLLEVLGFNRPDTPLTREADETPAELANPTAATPA